MSETVQVDYQVNESNEVIIKTTDGNICVEENLGVVNSDKNILLPISEQKVCKLNVVAMARLVVKEVLAKEYVPLTCKGVDFCCCNNNSDEMMIMEFYNTVFNHVMEIVNQDIIRVISPIEDGKAIIEVLQGTLEHLKNNYDIEMDFYVEEFKCKSL